VIILPETNNRSKCKKGKTYEQIYGKERAEEIKRKKAKTWNTSDSKKKASVSSKRTWGNPKIRKNRIKGIISSNNKRSKTLRLFWKNVPEDRKLEIFTDRNKKIKEYWDSLSIEDRKKRCSNLIKKWEDPSFRSKMSSVCKKRNALMSINGKTGTTYIELIMANMLDEQNILYETQKPIKYSNSSGCRKFPDFYIPEYKMIIECDGEEWHKDKEADNERDRVILSVLGEDWRIFHFMGKEIVYLNKLYKGKYSPKPTRIRVESG